MANEDGKLVKENKCLIDPKRITYGTTLPANSEGEDGDLFILLEE